MGPDLGPAAAEALPHRFTTAHWLLRQLDRIETEPSLLGASPHVLAIARR